MFGSRKRGRSALGAGWTGLHHGDMASMSPKVHGAHWLPESRAGWWTLALAALALTGIVLLAVGLAVGAVEAAESLTADWLLLGWGVAMLAAGVASVVTGGIAMAHHHEHSRLVALAMLLGLIVAAVMLREAAQGL
jgi:hypothetical protein